MKKFKHDPAGIMIHHSLTADSKTLSAEAIRRHHIEVNGWDDIGYHFLVEMVGDSARIVSGRSLLYQGAHCPAVNSSHIGVCVVGNFDKTVPPYAVLEVLVRLCLGIMEFYPAIRARDVTFHSQHSTKTCPGKLFPATGLILRLTEQLERRGR